MLRLRNIVLLRDAARLHQLSEYRFIERQGRGDGGVAPGIPHRDRSNGPGELIELFGVAGARFRIDMDMEPRAAFGFDKIALAVPWRVAVFIRPDLDEHKLVTVIGKILERFFAAAVVEKVGDYNDQPALRKIV